MNNKSNLANLLRNYLLPLYAVLHLPVLHSLWLRLNTSALLRRHILLDLHHCRQLSHWLIHLSQLVVLEHHKGDVAVGGGDGEHGASSPGEVGEGCIVIVAHAEDGLQLLSVEDEHCGGSSHCVHHVVALLEESFLLVLLHE